MRTGDRSMYCHMVYFNLPDMICDGWISGGKAAAAYAVHKPAAND